MTGSFASTDSSKTLTTATTTGPAALTSILTHAPHEFLQPSGNAIQDAALNLVKRYFDPLLAGGAGSGLDTVYLEGFDVEQVWEQVRGVVEGLALSAVEEESGEDEESSGEGSDRDFQSVGSEEESEEESAEEGESEEEDEEEEEGEEDFAGFDDEAESEDGGVAIAEEEKAGEEAGSDLEEEREEDEDENPEVKELVEDVHGLNDGFFSIDDFNRQTELLELQDSRGNVGSDDEDDIDFTADPNTLQDSGEEDEDDEEEASPRKKAKKSHTATDDYEEDDEEDDGDMDLDRGMGENANDIRYEDFFAPPAKKRAGGKPRDKKKVSWREDVKRADPATEFEAIESEMDRVRRDLFADEDEESDDDDVDMDGDPGNPMNRRSSHQKRQAALMEEIQKLEAENVAKRQWVMAGEAKARDRPLNSLLEQDLDFERTGKPVPVITQEVTEGLEDMIKRRILAGQFDEVIKRRPGDVSEKFRRGRVEVDDSKPTESLAEVYAKEHLKSTSAETNPEAADEKLQKEHKEIEALWMDVSRKLDALTSWHYTPKPPKPTLAIVSDAPAISMEEAQPSAAAGGMAANVSMLAPQEIYKAGQDKAYVPAGEHGGREIVGKSGAPVSTREMSSDDKKRRRRREKAKIRNRNAAEGIKRGEVKKGSKKDVVDTLKRGNVAIIGKHGEKRGVDGKEITEKSGRGKTGNFLKL